MHAQTRPLADAALGSRVDLSVLVDERGCCGDLSDAVADLLRSTREQLVGTRVCDWFSTQDVETLCFIRDQLRQDESLRTTVRLHVRGTERMWFDLAAFRLSDGGDSHIVVTARDVTDETRAMQQLLQAEQQWRLSFEHSPIGAAVVDEHWQVQLVNDTLAHMLGYAPAELVGTSLGALTGDRLLDESRLADLIAGRPMDAATAARAPTRFSIR